MTERTEPRAGWQMLRLPNLMTDLGLEELPEPVFQGDARE